MIVTFNTAIGSTILPGNAYFILEDGFSPMHYSVGLLPNGDPVELPTLSNISVNTTAVSQVVGLGTRIVSSDDTSMQIDYTTYYERIATSLETLVTLAQTGGIHVTRPYEWTSVASLIKYYQDNGINLADFKKIVDTLPKEDGF
jgi:hypothetical protein